MVLGVGIDIVKVDKIKVSLEKWKDSFLERVFNPEELENISKNKLYYQRIAARFAAKEAIIKALSKSGPLALKDMLILNKENGAPFCKFKNNIGVDIFLSITHIEDYAVACAVAQKKM
ncbi:MAG: holo-ACP synthase [Candidatus Omnitrophica bacterium]|nr:holo-ACP synthase [Candidatus Omnitrophota bacterium]MCK5494114.1 holo-ACP synthase [Candidatus Omnitrophota bacterium]